MVELSILLCHKQTIFFTFLLSSNLILDNFYSYDMILMQLTPKFLFL